jgi:hypothetical protein
MLTENSDTIPAHHGSSTAPPSGSVKQAPPASDISLPTPHIFRLPTELLQNIFSWLGPCDFLSCRQSCTRFLSATEDRRLFAWHCKVNLDKQSLDSLKQLLFRNVTYSASPFQKCRSGLGQSYRTTTTLHTPSGESLVIILGENASTFFAVASKSVVYIFLTFKYFPTYSEITATPPTMIFSHRSRSPVVRFYASQSSVYCQPQQFILLLIHDDDSAVIIVGALGSTNTLSIVLKHPCCRRYTQLIGLDRLRVKSARVDVEQRRIFFQCDAGTAIYDINKWSSKGKTFNAIYIRSFRWIPAVEVSPQVTQPLVPSRTLGLNLCIIAAAPYTSIVPRRPILRLKCFCLEFSRCDSLNGDGTRINGLVFQHPPHQSTETMAGYASCNYLVAVRYIDGEIWLFESKNTQTTMEGALLGREHNVLQMGFGARWVYGKINPLVALVVVKEDQVIVTWQLSVVPRERRGAVRIEGMPRGVMSSIFEELRKMTRRKGRVGV